MLSTQCSFNYPVSLCFLYYSKSHVRRCVSSLWFVPLCLSYLASLFGKCPSECTPSVMSLQLLLFCAPLPRFKYLLGITTVRRDCMKRLNTCWVQWSCTWAEGGLSQKTCLPELSHTFILLNITGEGE